MSQYQLNAHIVQCSVTLRKSAKKKGAVRTEWRRVKPAQVPAPIAQPSDTHVGTPAQHTSNALETRVQEGRPVQPNQ